VSNITAAQFQEARRQLAEARETQARLTATHASLQEEYQRLEQECQQTLGCSLAELVQKRQEIEAQITQARAEFYAALGKVPNASATI